MLNEVQLDISFKYIIILRESEKLCASLKSKWNEKQDKKTELQLREAFKIRNNAFVGLMRESFPCSFIRDFELDSNGIVAFVINVDGDIFECRDNVIRDILGDNYDAIVKEYINTQEKSEKTEKIIPKDEIKIKDVDKSVEENVNKNIELDTNNIVTKINTKEDVLPSINQEEKSCVETIQDKSCVLVENEVDKKGCVDVNKDLEVCAGKQSEHAELKSEEKEKSKAKIKEKKPKSTFSYIEPSEPEPRKKLDTMLFDFNDVGIINKENKTGEYVNFTIAPLSIPTSGDAIVCDIFVCMETNEKKKIFVSEKNGIKTVSTKIGEYEFLVKGSFEKGKFVSEIYPANTMTSDKYIKKEDKTSYNPKNFKNIGFGHVVDFIKNEDELNSKIHIIPLELENNGSGMVNIMVCVDDPDGVRQTYVADDNIIIHKSGKLTYQIFGYWENDEFISKIKLRD